MMRTVVSLLVGILVFSSVAPKALAQIVNARQCQVRISVLESFVPFRAAISAAERLNLAGSDLAAGPALAAFDRDLGAALDTVPASEEAVFALTDAERIVEAVEACADKIGVARGRLLRAGSALDAAYLRNQTIMSRPDFSYRLMRSPRAQRVLQTTHQTGVIEAARLVKTRNEERQRLERIAAAEAAAERERAAQAAAAEKERLARAALDETERIWRDGASGPPAGTTACSDAQFVGYSSRGAQWLAAIDREIGKCGRVSDRRDGVYFVGLALGAPVTDAQMAHASGRLQFCFSDRGERRLLEGTNQITDALSAAIGLGSTAVNARPIWTERSDGSLRIVQIRCEISMNVFGIDLQKMQGEMAAMLRSDPYSFVEFELVNQRLTAIRFHEIRSNQVSQTTSGNSTELICDADLGQADSAARRYVNSGWRHVARLPYRYTMANGAVTAAFAGDRSAQIGRWYTLQRGSVILDVMNTRYSAPVIGQNGECYGGAVDYFAMLPATRAARVRPAVRVAW